MNFFGLPATCFPNHCFCEAFHIGYILQNANSWSSLAFLVGALALIVLAYRSKSKPDWLDWSFAIIFTIIGLGSFYYHAQLSFFGQTLDVFGMYLLATLVFFTPLYALKIWSKQQTIAGYSMANLALLALLIYYPSVRRYVFALLVAGAIATLLLLKDKLSGKQIKYFWSSLIALLVGYIFWLLDIQKILCNPNSIIQSHAIWHIASATSALFISLFLTRNRT